MSLLGLEPALRDRYPHQLSGGQQQRVGVARALAANPQVLLMDEPFGALDPVTRGALQAEMTRIHRILGRTIVLVTHDIDEALRPADHLVLMDHGEVVQQGSPLELLNGRRTTLCASFWPQRVGRQAALPANGERLYASGGGAGERRTAAGADEPAGCALRVCRAPVRSIARCGCRGAPCGTLHFRDLLAGEVTREGTA